MDEYRTNSPTAHHDPHRSTDAPDPLDKETEEPVDFWKNFRWLAARITALMGAIALMGALVTGFAGWYTSRPDFCRSCHIMEPYYDSWAESSHAHVSCTDCHFPPGAAEKARGKVLGLVQLAKYVTGTHGPRPIAEIPDESCLRSGCHDTRLLAGRIDFHGMPFDHASHLGDLRRGMELRCTSCHSQIVQDVHMTVTVTTCFLCHFKEIPFNESIGACTRCHQIPDKDYELGGGTVFHHEQAYEKGIDCASCHSDLIPGPGAGAVAPERCRLCHHRKEDLQRIDEVLFMHQKHVSDHKVDCLLCHQEIKHSLDPQRMLHAVSDCASCHPGHHQPQLEMMAGTGGRTLQAPATGMAEVRMACQSCHAAAQTPVSDSAAWTASMNTCLQCHDQTMADLLETYHRTLREALVGLNDAVVRIRDALPAAAVAADAVPTIAVQLDDVEHDIRFLQVGNGIHNIHYANALTRGLVDQVTDLCRRLELPQPEIRLPEPLEPEPAEPEPAEPEPAEPEPAEPERDEPEGFEDESAR
jgi:predicted CXXCH cytochrome family protein